MAQVGPPEVPAEVGAGRSTLQVPEEGVTSEVNLVLGGRTVKHPLLFAGLTAVALASLGIHTYAGC